MKLPSNAASIIARRAAGRRAKLDGLVAEMHALYMQGKSFHEVARRYDRSRGCIRELFTRRGLHVRPFREIERQPNGAPLRYVPFTPEQLDALIAGMTKLHVPPALKKEWRTWPMARRGDFLARVRAHLQLPSDRPTTPFSAGLEPYDYTSPRAWEIANRLNAGLTSREAAIKLDLRSQGVIWEARLWFWNHKVGYQSGSWTKENGRPTLHRTIWERAHARKMPRGHVIRFVDGNRNNFDTANLRLATRNDVVRENQAAALLRKSRARTELILKRQQHATRHALTDRLLTTTR